MTTTGPGSFPRDNVAIAARRFARAIVGYTGNALETGMLFLLNTIDRTKSWVANHLGLRRLFNLTNYLLVRQLNADLPSEGPEGNRRLQDAFLGLFDTLEPSLFLDIGANDGTASIAVREAAPACEVHAFEANPQIHAKNRNRLEEYGIRDLGT